MPINILQTLLPLLGLLLTSSLFAQPTEDGCRNPTATVDLDVNAVRARITNGGDLWWDGNNGVYRVDERNDSPRQDSPIAIYAGGLWLGARGAGGEMKVAAQSYGRLRGWFDYYPGPLHNGEISRPDCADWDRTFPIYREEIRDFRAAYDPENPPVASDVPANIASWPGAGNPLFEELFGFSMPDYLVDMAPFEDENGDGIYNPLDGDYPLFCGDQAVWTIFNDAGDIHRNSQTPTPLKTEIHLLAYAFASEDSLLHRTTFYDYKIINRGEEALLDLYAGHWIDTHMGCNRDDRVNSAPDHNLFYAYNEEGRDQSICGNTEATYDSITPVNIYQVLRSNAIPENLRGGRLMSSFLNFYGSTIHPPHFGSLLPSTAEGYYNNLRGVWADGTPVTRGRDGYAAGGDTTHYSYDGGVAEDGSTWWHCNTNTFNDFSQLYSTGPYNLQPGGTAEFTFAITTVFGVPFPDSICPDTAAVYAAANHIKEIYDQNCTRSVLTDTEAPRVPASIGLAVFPNPTAGKLSFRLPTNLVIDRVEVLDLAGRQLVSQRGNGNELGLDLRASGLAAGIYVYRLRTVNGETVVGRVVVME